MSGQNDPSKADVLAVLDRMADALRNKDLDALEQCYASDVRVFDVGSQTSGFAELRNLWESCFPYFPNPIEIQRKDLEANIGEDVAILSFFSRVTGIETDHPSAKAWLRTTVCLKKFRDQWKIVHDHISVPVDCGAEKLVYLLDES